MSAGEEIRSRFHWNGRAYVFDRSDAILAYGNRHLTKPASTIVHFAAGTDSAIVGGNELLGGYDDVYGVDGRKGQMLSVTILAPFPATTEMSLSDQNFDRQ